MDSAQAQGCPVDSGPCSSVGVSYTMTNESSWLGLEVESSRRALCPPHPGKTSFWPGHRALPFPGVSPF